MVVWIPNFPYRKLFLLVLIKGCYLAYLVSKLHQVAHCLLNLKSVWLILDRVVQRWHPKLVLLLVGGIGNMHMELLIMGGISQSNGWRYSFSFYIFFCFSEFVSALNDKTWYCNYKMTTTVLICLRIKVSEVKYDR